MRVRAGAVALAAVLLLSSCGTAATGSGTAAVQPRDGQSGLQLSGTVDGRQIAINDGLPELVVGDCDPLDGVDSDVCAISRTIDGRLFVVSLENPAVLQAGTRLDVSDPACGSPQACDAVTDVAIVDVQFDTDPRVRATGGTLELDAVEEFQRYAGSLRLQLPDGGRLNGFVDLVPRPD